MPLLGQTLGLISIFSFYLFLPLGCKASIANEEISMEYIEDDIDRFYLKQSRKLLGEGSNHIVRLNSSSLDNGSSAFWFILCVALFLFFLLLIKCCIRLGKEENRETSRITVHPPPRTRSSTPSYANSRPLASPRTSSRSLILLPEPGNNHDVYLAIENPNFTLYTTVNLPTLEEEIHQPITPPTQQQDLPPDYDSVVTANQQNNNRSILAINIPNDFQNSEKSPPPKYDDVH